ncbi:hypothetical protein SB782_05290 [Brevibacillus sp. SIMBA_076]
MEDVADLDAVVAVVAVAVARAVVHAAARAVVLAAASVPAHAVALSSFRYPTVVIRIIEKISLSTKLLSSDTKATGALPFSVGMMDKERIIE